MDLIVTLLFQPATYWQGDFQAVHEGNPLARWLLAQSPWCFVTVALLWMLVFSAIVLCWHHSFTFVLTWLITFGHAYGMASWFLAWGTLGWCLAATILVLAYLFLSWSWRRSTLNNLPTIKRKLHSGVSSSINTTENNHV